jgi:putative transposase
LTVPFYSFREAQILVERWRRTYNAVRPHSALGYRPPAPEAAMIAFPSWTKPPGSAQHRTSPMPPH